MATAQLAGALADRLPLVYSAVFILVASLAVQYFFKRDPLAHIPFAGPEQGSEEKRRQAFLTGAKHIYLDGYRKFRNRLFRVTTAANPNMIQVPPELLNELRMLPDDVLSFGKAIDEGMVSKYTKIITSDVTLTHAIRSSLTPALPRINPILTEEVARTVRNEVGPCPDWTEININQKLLRIVAVVSGRIFLGPELCRDERYIEAAVNYTLEIFNSRNAVLELRPWQRPFRASSLPAVRRLDERLAEFKAIIEPVVHARREAARTDPNYEKPDDMLQWLLDAKDKAGEHEEDRYLAMAQLTLSFAAIHTTTLTATNAFYDLAAHPELIPQIREECSAALARDGGVFTSSGLQSLKKLDSCLKESLRVNPLGFSAFQRKVLKPLTLSNGMHVPAGATIEVPAYGTTREEGNFPDPERWDGLRFYRMAAEGGGLEAKAHSQFVSVSQQSLTFGFGRHACPGRFFAANEIKMIVARALLEYDVKLAGGATERYPNIEFSGACMPDPSKALLFKAIN